MHWYQTLDFAQGPLYQVIAQAIARAVRTGELQPEQRLPAQRTLAKEIGCTLGTISRAYQLTNEMGLTRSTTGSGSYICAQHPFGFAIPDVQGPALINMSINTPLLQSRAELMGDALAALAQRLSFDPALMDYQIDQGALRQRQVLCDWYRTAGLDCQPEQLCMTAGAQHGLALVLSTFTRPGDAILAEAVSYPGLRPLAERFGLTLHPLPIDQQGLIPEALDEQCRRHLPRLLFCNPRFHNPTSSWMSERRKQQLATLARQHQLLVVEDDILAHFGPTSAPLYNLYPEQTIYLSSLSKSLAPGLRIGLLVASPTLMTSLSQTLRQDIWMASPMMAELAVRCIESGYSRQLQASDQRELSQRATLLKPLITANNPGCTVQYQPGSPHGWLHLPAQRDALQFVEQLQHKGVLLKPASDFTLPGVQHVNAVRFSLSAPLTRDQLHQGLQLIQQQLCSQQRL